MDLLVLYSTSEGHTAKIARKIVEVLENRNHNVTLTATSDPGYCDPATFDAAILCAPIHMASYPSDFVQFVTDWKHSLQKVTTMLVTSSLLIAADSEEKKQEAEQYPIGLAESSGWQPDQIYNVAGSLNYPEYDLFKRWIMKLAARELDWSDDTSKEFELTDWKELKLTMDDFLNTFSKKVA